MRVFLIIEKFLFSYLEVGFSELLIIITIFQIRDSVCQLLTNLPESPPDVETLRIYISLPLYHEFENARHSSKLQGPFANAILKLKTEAAKIVGKVYL